MILLKRYIIVTFGVVGLLYLRGGLIDIGEKETHGIGGFKCSKMRSDLRRCFPRTHFGQYPNLKLASLSKGMEF